MTKADILIEIRVLLNELTEGFFLDSEINNWIDQSAVDISTKTGCYEQTHTFETEDGTMEYDEPSGCIKTHFCTKDGCKRVERFDNTYWSTSGSQNQWTGTRWQLYVVQNGSQQRSISPIGTWAQNYRPSRIRVTYTGVALDGLMLWDTEQTVIAGALDNAFESGDSLDITWDGHDIGWITAVMPPEYLYITNIEFYEPGFEYKGFIKAHPRLAGHVGDAISGEPCAWYHDHNKIGLVPVANDVYPAKAYYSKITDDITDLPVQYQPYAILYGLHKGLLKDKQRNSAKLIEIIYLNNLLFHRQDLCERQLDSKEMFKLPNRLLEK